jgi:hypothetical protein
LGAGAQDSQGHDLTVHTFLNGTEVVSMVLDTSAVATDTIDYVATNGAGNTATSSRTVLIEASLQTPPPQNPQIATTTEATSTTNATVEATSTNTTTEATSTNVEATSTTQ